MGLLDKVLKKEAKISVLGLGYIGLPTSVIFASIGFKVFGYDKNSDVINKLKAGEVHIFEPDLEGLFKKVLDREFFVPTDKIVESDIFIICVPTPYKIENGIKVADLKYVEEAARSISKILRKDNLVILESTVPPGTTENILIKILENSTNLKVSRDFYVVYSPERVLPGRILQEIRTNNRIIGSDKFNKKGAEIAKALYSEIVEGEIFITDIKTAEMCKLIENAYRDVNIAFANEISMIAHELGINVRELIDLANKHPRVSILSPGTGVGGHCIAVDPWFIVEKFPTITRLIKTAREVNDHKPKWLANKIDELIREKFKNRRIAEITVGILGLAYKPNVDDLRESPSLVLINHLKEKGYKILVSEPFRKEKKIQDMENLMIEELVKKSDVVVISVAHRVFREIDKKMFSDERKLYIDLVGITTRKGVVRF